MPIPECLKNCGSCPFAKACRGESAPSVKPITGKIIDFQARRIISTYSVVSGGPAPDVQRESGCTCGLRGICSECKKKKTAA